MAANAGSVVTARTNDARFEARRVGLSPVEGLSLVGAWLLGAVVVALGEESRTASVSARHMAIHAPTVWLLAWGTARLLGRGGWLGRSVAVAAWTRAVAIGVGQAVVLWGLGSVFWPDRPLRRLVLAGYAAMAAAILGAGRGRLERWRLAADERFSGLVERVGSGLDEILSRPDRTSCRTRLMTVVLGILLVGGSIGYAGYRSGWVPCSLDCGEHFDAYIGALNHERFGLRVTRGLMDIALDASVETHPRLYIHQPSLVYWLVNLGRALGVQELPQYSVLTVAIYGVGLAYLFGFVRGATSSLLMAGLALATVGSLYPLTTLWAFNLPRAPAWLLTFGPAYHLWRAGLGGSWRRTHLGIAAALVALGTGIDYALSVSTGATLVALAAAKIVGGGWRRVALVVAASLTAAWLAHHGLVIAALGFHYWLGDLLDVASRRQTVVALAVRGLERALGVNLLNAPSHEGGRAIVWPSPYQERDPVTALFDASWAMTSVAGPAFLLALAGWALAAMVQGWRGRETVVGGARSTARLGCGLVGCFLIGQAAPALALTGYYSTFAARHLFPQPVHAVTLLLGLTTYLLVVHARVAVRLWRRHVPIGALALAAFIAARAYAEAANYRTLPPRGEPARDALVGLRGRSVVATTWGPGVAAYTYEWASMLNRRGFRKFLADPVEDLVPSRDFHPEWQFRAYLGEPTDPRYTRPEFLLVSGGLPLPGCRSARAGVLAQVPQAGCAPADVALRLRHLPLHAEGPGYLIYDLRPVWAARDRTLPSAVTGGPRGAGL